MARNAPLVEGTTLLDQTSEGTPIELGTAAWQHWLAQATSFAFHGRAGRFTARKERRGRADGYWRAYRKQRGKLYSTYLGMSSDLTLERLEAVAQALADLAPTSTQSTRLHSAATLYAPELQSPHIGTVTVLLIDSDAFVRQNALPDEAQARVTMLLNEAIRAGSGESFVAPAAVTGGMFRSPLDALDAALTARRVLETEALTKRSVGDLCMAIHTGVPTIQGDDDTSHLVRWTLQLLSSGHGGQVLLSHVSGVLIREHLPPGVSLSHLGAYSFNDQDQPESVFQLVGTHMPTIVAPLRSPARRPHNLPVPATSLVGRERDVDAVTTTLQRADVRLLTLLGSGGVGKTRLALQAAEELRDHFANGTFFVDLASITDHALVVPTIVKTLGLIELGEQAPQERLAAYLATKQVLLLLDNFEQVLAAAPELAALLAAAPQVKLLVTSRAALQIDGEHEYPVLPLALLSDTDVHAPAITLFVQRAQAVKPGFMLTDAKVPLVAEICQRLDGLPLAIELAAARIKLFSPAALLQRLERRLPLLIGGARDLPARQQTIRNTCDWSYRLLDAPEQTLFRHLAVFVGGFTLEAAEVVCDDVDSGVDSLAILVDQSLLSAGEDSTGESRFSMLGTIHP